MDAAQAEAPGVKSGGNSCPAGRILAGIGAPRPAPLRAAGGAVSDHSGHFEIDGRRLHRGPSVCGRSQRSPGYITAVPVTDNQHVNAGDVIARIDDRDYRIALAQAEAQVAAAKANVTEHPTHKSTVQQAQITASQAQVGAGQGARSSSRSNRRSATRTGATKDGLVQPSRPET